MDKSQPGRPQPTTRSGSTPPGVATYEGMGLRLWYPTNWRVAEEVEREGVGTVSFEGPSTEFFTLHVFPPGYKPERLAAEVLHQMRREYRGLEATLMREEVAEVEVVGYNMHFFCMDLIVTSHVRSFCHADKTFLVQWQAEDREFDAFEMVAHAMLTSLIRELGE